MIGLIKKDLLIIKSNLKQYIVICLLVFFLSLNGNDFAYFLPVFLSMSIYISTFSYDNLSNFDSYAISLPVKRKNIVKAKYLGSLLMFVLGCLFTLGYAFILSLFRDINFIEILITVYGGFIGIIVLEAILYPLIFKFGIEKGRVFLFVIIAFIGAIFGIALEIGDLTIFSKILNNKIFIILINLFIIGLFLLSYYIARRIILKKDY